ncbi:MAG: hypothetical protein ACRED0_00570, partial [Gammaproteobacteria bacterium]
MQSSWTSTSLMSTHCRRRHVLIFVGQLGFSEKEAIFAASLLDKHSVAETKGFIDYGLAEAAKTNFDIKSLGGLKKYYTPFVKQLIA